MEDGLEDGAHGGVVCGVELGESYLDMGWGGMNFVGCGGNDLYYCVSRGCLWDKGSTYPPGVTASSTDCVKVIWIRVLIEGPRLSFCVDNGDFEKV